ncbi:MAG TPA: hypothetical protein VH300_14690 [Thermoleophilaceae bacterium]|nr:hypothetical protein [Thermoleophilaceae bacterium]
MMWGVGRGVVVEQAALRRVATLVVRGGATVRSCAAGYSQPF